MIAFVHISEPEVPCVGTDADPAKLFRGSHKRWRVSDRTEVAVIDSDRQVRDVVAISWVVWHGAIGLINGRYVLCGM